MTDAQRSSDETRLIPQTVSGRLIGIRSDLLRLVTALNEAGAYKDAADCQGLVVAVDAFEDGNGDFERCVWPPESDGDGGLVWVKNYGE